MAASVSTLHAQGLQALQTGAPQEAESLFEQALHQLPQPWAQTHPDLLVHLGVAQCQQEKYAAGRASFEAVLRAAPQHPGALINLLRLAQRLGDQALLLKTGERWLQTRPGDHETRRLLARSYVGQKQPQRALQHYRHLLEVGFQPAETWLELGMTQRQLGQDQAAVAAYRKALQFEPHSLRALNNLGLILSEQGKWQAAQDCYARALEIAPREPTLLQNLGNLYEQLGQTEAALKLFQRFHDWHPQHLGASDGLVRLKLLTCDWQGLEDLNASLQAAAEDEEQAAQISPYNSLFLPFDARQQYLVARAQARRVAQKIAAYGLEIPARPQPAPGAGGTRRLCLGYFSADFREHILADMVSELFARHDRERFEIYAYACAPSDNSAQARHLRQHSDCFRDLSALPAPEAAAQIRHDQVDLLIYLGGYSDGDRPEILALNPAPLQLSYVDYPATLGVDFIDYLIADAQVLPDELLPWFSEKRHCLPQTYQINNDRLPRPPDPQDEPNWRRSERRAQGLPEAAFVFCCFNKANRIDPSIFALWMRLLTQVPQSVLWLLRQNTLAENNLRAAAVQAGIAPERLIFAPNLPRQQHLPRQACADLFLDTRYTNGHTTAADALWAGVPVLTCPGQTFSARVGLSLLHAVGLPELIAHDLEHYEHLALTLARSPELLHSYRQRLWQAGPQSSLFDTNLRVRELEAAYLQLWERHFPGA